MGWNSFIYHISINSDKGTHIFDEKCLLVLQGPRSNEADFGDRQMTYMIFTYFKMSDAQGTVLNKEYSLIIKLKEDNVRAFDTFWHDTILGLPAKLGSSLLESLHRRQLATSS